MVDAVRRGESGRAVANRYGVSPSVVQRWVQRAAGKDLDDVDWSDRSHTPHTVANRTSIDTEREVLALRKHLKESSDLGEYGAKAIQGEMLAREIDDVPAERTINRILERNGLFDRRRRVRRAAPAPGWYLPDVASREVEIDLFDTVSGLILEGGTEIEVLTAISLHGGLAGAWVHTGIKAGTVRESLIEHWRENGCPNYAQFDNDNRFQGPHHHKDIIGSVIRLCLSLKVTPVFVPPREVGFQASIESFNNRWQQKVWHRCHHESEDALRALSSRYVAATRRKTALRQEGMPGRQAFPVDWKPDPEAELTGKIIFLRRTNGEGQVYFLGRSFEVDPHWPHRLVRAEVDLDLEKIRFYALRRREPSNQPLLQELPYSLPNRGSRR